MLPMPGCLSTDIITNHRHQKTDKQQKPHVTDAFKSRHNRPLNCVQLAITKINTKPQSLICYTNTHQLQDNYYTFIKYNMEEQL